LCFNIGGFLACFYNGLAALIVASIAVRWILVAVVLMLICGICLFKFVLTGYKDLNRVESVTKSPMLSLLQETQSGQTVIRAFQREKKFKEQNYELVNKNTLANQMAMGVWNWYSMRMDLLSTVTLAVGASFCVYYRTRTNPILLSLMLQYMMTLQMYCMYTLYQFGEVEKQMVSV
jgi:ABC-type multidrug transport system fused ATPase/permease subunit